MRAAANPSIWRYLWSKATPLDRLAAIYIFAFGVGLLFLGEPGATRSALIAVHAGLLLAIAAILHFWNDRVRGVSGFLRLLYVPLLYMFFYSETQVAVHWLFPTFFDGQLIDLEQSLLGTVPNTWIIPFQTTVLNEWMMLGYFSYYLLVPILALTMFFRRHYQPLNAFLTASTLAFVISYIGFIVYPVEGPRFFMAEHFAEPLRGIVFVPLVRSIIDNAAIHGGCMPSSHVAVALVVLVWAYRTYRRLAVALTPIILTLFAATVWGRFHYLSDVVVGIVVGWMGLYVGDRMARGTQAITRPHFQGAATESSVSRV